MNLFLMEHGFKYLGSLITVQNDTEYDINVRIFAGNKSHYAL